MRGSRALFVTVVLAMGMSAVDAWAEPTGTYTGYWKGKTGQSKEIKFHVNSGNKIDSLTASLNMPSTNCGGSSVSTKYTYTFKPPLVISSSGTFSYTGSGGLSSWKGTFTAPKMANGKLTGQYSDPTTGCNFKKTTTWKATRP